LKPGSRAAIRQTLQAPQALHAAQEAAKRQWQAQMEDLIRKADALAPGSGEKIRSLLQSGAPKPAMPGEKAPIEFQRWRLGGLVPLVSDEKNKPQSITVFQADPNAPKPVDAIGQAPARPLGVRFPDGPANSPKVKGKMWVQVELNGNNVSFLVEDDTILQLLSQEALKGNFAVKDIRETILKAKMREDAAREAAGQLRRAWGGVGDPRTGGVGNAPIAPPPPPRPKDAPTKGPTAPPGRDLEVLERELQRLTAELNLLRQQIERSKAK
jgi:hypothetical protein